MRLPIRLLTTSGIADKLDFGRELLEVDLVFTLVGFFEATEVVFSGCFFLLFLRGSNGKRPR
jgi:hypothetical protein